MGFITDSMSNRLWVNVANGQLTYTKKSDGTRHDHNAYEGVILGVRVRQKVYDNKPCTAIDVEMHDPADSSSEGVIITGTLFGTNGMPTVFGRMLVECLAHQDLKERKGHPVRISVWRKWVKEDQFVTCCTFYNPDTNTTFGRLKLKDIPEGQIRQHITTLVEEIKTHFGPISSPHDQPGGPATAGAAAPGTAVHNAPTGSGHHDPEALEEGVTAYPFAEENDGLPF